ncbi:MAG: hypothetical protein ACXVLX_18900 [Ilumatobacteraceae bacterium]
MSIRSTFGGVPAVAKAFLQLEHEPLGGDRALHHMQQRQTGVFVDH